MNLKQRHGFRITVERLPLGDDTPENRTDFDVGSHDDLLDIMRRVRSIDSFQTDEAYALAVGIKLFSGVMLTHRNAPLFAAIQPAIHAFIGRLKATVAAAQQGASTGA